MRALNFSHIFGFNYQALLHQADVIAKELEKRQVTTAVSRISFYYVQECKLESGTIIPEQRFGCRIEEHSWESTDPDSLLKFMQEDDLIRR